jgi:hypothetical protein
MRTLPEDELTAEEGAAIDALPKERTPPRVVEQWLLRTLHDRRILQPAGRSMTPLKWLGAFAAGVLLFAGGMGAGEQLQSRADARAGRLMSSEDSRRLAAAVQRTGSEYVAAVARLRESIEAGASADQLAPGREAALAALEAAARELLTIAPEAGRAADIVADIDNAVPTPQDDPVRRRRVIWF